MNKVNPDLRGRAVPAAGYCPLSLSGKATALNVQVRWPQGTAPTSEPFMT